MDGAQGEQLQKPFNVCGKPRSEHDLTGGGTELAQEVGNVGFTCGHDPPPPASLARETRRARFAERPRRSATRRTRLGTAPAARSAWPSAVCAARINSGV